jgi:hypothetical protein
MAAPGTSGAAGEVAAVSRAAADREVTDASAAKKVTPDTAAAERATADKRATDAAAEEKVADDATAVEKATVEAAPRGVAKSSPTPAAGAKRSVISGCSNPPVKR